MDSLKLKLKVGEHEFEAEGPQEVVQAQFRAFQELVASLPTARSQAQSAETAPAGRDADEAVNDGNLSLDKIMRQDGRVISLTVGGESLEDEVLMLMLGQSRLRGNDSVSGGEILEGLRQQRGAINRIDYRLGRMADSGVIRSFGTRRARRYRLTNQGLAKAQELAKSVLANIP